MFRRFLKDVRGNYVMLTAISMVPIMGALAIGIDYTELSNQRAATMSALDAAGIATARRIAQGASEADVKAYAKDFFEANLGGVDPAKTQLIVTLPNNNYGGGTLKLEANLTYEPRFLPVAAMLTNRVSSSPNVGFKAEAEIRLKNTLEVALVLDNSGSMDEYGAGTTQKRIALLRTASKELVETLAKQASQMKQIAKPVQFALVPFSASVNIAPASDDKSWMDTMGVSPMHHENFDWSKMTYANRAQLGDRWAEKVGAVWYKRGDGWGLTKDQPLTRFSLYSDMLAETDREEVPGSRHCVSWRNNGTCRSYSYDYTYETSQFASWQGCVEARPYPYNTNDATPDSSTPATLFVPMFAPDEAGNRWRDLDHDDVNDLSAGNSDFDYNNSWWADWEYGNTGVLDRQRDARKYFRVKPYGSSSSGSGYGPNYSCTTSPVTPLTDVTVEASKQIILDAIDAMRPTNNTNVPEGTAWGWRMLSSNEPFTEGRPNDEKGNDKVVIVLTDGANVYGNQSGDDDAGNETTYAAYGYAGHKFPDTETTSRLYKGTSVSKTTFTSSNYQAALDEHMRAICANAKGANVLMMTVALDLDETKTADKKQIAELKSCASDSRFRKGPDGNPAKLFWNATGATLSKVFKEIADELSNLRIVG
ncbi:pilus assembly protein [Mesorhizobium sp. ZMM04-5]|uniref:Pilus assembly protein n=1 Tax=Mesorhizobium marinum TaxID=3228790 RepID=A0ABV3R0W0_9HYPH